jgi:hypothetical protein
MIVFDAKVELTCTISRPNWATKVRADVNAVCCVTVRLGRTLRPWSKNDLHHEFELINKYLFGSHSTGRAGPPGHCPTGGGGGGAGAALIIYVSYLKLKLPYLQEVLACLQLKAPEERQAKA